MQSTWYVKSFQLNALIFHIVFIEITEWNLNYLSFWLIDIVSDRDDSEDSFALDFLFFYLKKSAIMRRKKEECYWELFFIGNLELLW